MDNFINLIKNTRDIKANEAEETIIRGLMVQNKRQNDKLEDLSSYDSESLFNGKMYRGNMYIFTYNAKNPTKYSYKGGIILLDVYISLNTEFGTSFSYIILVLVSLFLST